MNRIVHLGVGNFHRAHQAWYTQVANALSSGTGTGAAVWRITGVSLRSAGVRDALRDQGYGYALSISGAEGTELHRVGVIDDILVASESPERVIAAIASPDVAVVTLTVTEKGYTLGADGRVDLAAITDDIEALRVGVADTGQAPRSTLGLLTAGLARRAASGVPLTVLSCDNLPDNGVKLAAAVREVARAAELDIERWFDEAVAFPSSMVDRITPATDEALCARVAGTSLPPALPVATEAFSEWVIEDRFTGPRPAWEHAGAVLTDDVRPFEQRKLRLLNGAHSYLAYAGTLAGHTFVHEAIADPALRRWAAALMVEATATLPASVRDDAPAYADALLARFANPHLAHRLRQIAMDGSLKLPIRLLATIDDRTARGLDSPACERALDAWHAFLVAEIAAGRDIDDPAAERLRRSVREGGTARALLGANT